MNSRGRVAIFSILFGVAYTVAFFGSWAAFKYYPLVGEFHFVDQGKQAGPPISWYGWMATALIVSLPVSFLVPSKFSNKIPAGAVAIISAILIFVVLVYEKRWFL